MNPTWQERGLRIGGEVLDPEEAKAIVAELKRRIKDPSILQEVEAFLAGRQAKLSERARDALYLSAIGLLMMRRQK